MRRDLVTQIIVEWSNGEIDNFATPFEAEYFINTMLDELGIPRHAWLEDMSGNKKWDYSIVEDDNGAVHLID